MSHQERESSDYLLDHKVEAGFARLTDGAHPVFEVDASTATDKAQYAWSALKSGEYLAAALRSTRGLVLINGGTGCGKTTWLNALLYQILKSLKPADKASHIVCVGDPVETWLYPEPQKHNPLKVQPRASYVTFFRNNAEHLKIRFTARLLGVDVESVEQATIDGLRETPKIFVISELREDKDFRKALAFAGTGHLVLATAHATSLVDAMTRLLRVEEANSASDRSMIAQRLAMLVFLKPVPVEQKAVEKETKVVLPKVWRNNPLGFRSFVADGLASLQVPGAWKPRLNVDTQLGSDAGMLSYRHAVECLGAALAKDNLKLKNFLEDRADWLDLNHE
jgi:hypothetical protein